MASPALTRFRRTAMAVTSNAATPTPSRARGSASTSVTERSDVPTGGRGAGDIVGPTEVRVRVPVSRVMDRAPLHLLCWGQAVAHPVGHCRRAPCSLALRQGAVLPRPRLVLRGDRGVVRHLVHRP